MKIEKCPHYGSCGGCSLRHLSYTKQIRLKEQNLKILFDNFPASKIKTIVPAPKINYFRNRMDFACGASSGGIRLGLKEKGRFDNIINITKCPVFSETAGTLLNFLRAYIKNYRLSAYDPQTKSGTFRYFIMREGKNTGDFLLNIVTTICDKKTVSGLADALKLKFPQISCCVWSASDSVSDDSKSDLKKIFWGSGFFNEKLLGVTFSVSYNSFFQTNTSAAELLCGYVKKLLNKKTRVRLFDFYCGTGGIGLAAAPKTADIIGVELNFEALRDARSNAKANGIKKFIPVCAKTEKIIKALKFKKSDIALVDPPRAGIGAKTARKLCDSAIRKLIYVSCNPKTLAIDLQTLTNAFKLKLIQPFDLFPHTPHIECVALLEK